ncbi:MAG: flagellar basal body-associated FliL family protein [Kofleriaceae bacterium]|nr:flagellar basal body-associated FliL family protein [Myxococcales bacterium]MCB9562624.1 flagellar basal body-associated FliL family protein [Kofleriaceae bacterium]MCB9574558.1 flagellar basal body-associated FliL family protein [Kofleriaceae bacterium]
MSDDDETDAAPAPDATAPAKGGGARVGVLVAAVNLAATGFLVFRSLTAQAGHAAPATHEAEPAGTAAAVSGPVVALDPFVINLRDEGVSRYLKVSFELELSNHDAVVELDRAKRVVRDDLLRYLSGLAVADTLGEDAKQHIQDAVVARLDHALGEGRVRRLFFTEFVVQ